MRSRIARISIVFGVDGIQSIEAIGQRRQQGAPAARYRTAAVGIDQGAVIGLVAKVQEIETDFVRLAAISRHGVPAGVARHCHEVVVGDKAWALISGAAADLPVRRERVGAP